jgi:hypothetical protein
MRGLEAPRITVAESEKYNIFFGNAVGMPGTHSYNFLFHHLYSFCIQFVFSSMYLYMYIAAHLHTVYLDWLQELLESDLRCAKKSRLTGLRDSLRGRDRVTLELHLESVIDSLGTYTWRP